MNMVVDVAGAITGPLELIDRLETYVNRYFERKDLAKDLSGRLKQVQERNNNALQESAILENSRIDELPTCNDIVSRALSDWKQRLQQNSETLESLSHDIQKGGVLVRVRRKTNILKECEKNLTAFHTYLHCTVIPSLRQSITADVDAADSYRPFSNVPPNPPRLTLNYDSEDTYEGRLKSAIVKGSTSGMLGVVASGLGGVGKTCALRGLAKDSDIKAMFHGGVLYIQLGNDKNISDVINGIARVAAITGGERLAGRIRGLRDFEQALLLATKWFKPHKCLLLVDDIWVVNGIDTNVLTGLRTMLADESLLVYTTRQERMSQGANEEIRFEERDCRGAQAISMLWKHARFNTMFADVKQMGFRNRTAFNGILDLCQGLPLALGIAGASVWEYCKNRKVNKQEAWSYYYKDLTSRVENLGNGSVYGYGPLSLIVDRSLHMLKSKEKSEKKAFEKMFRAFCVLRKQQSVCGRMLQNLWDLGDLREAREVAEAFNEVSLVRMTRESGNMFQIQMHDLILDIAMRKAVENCEVKICFRTLADNYMRRDRCMNTSMERKDMATEAGPSTTKSRKRLLPIPKRSRKHPNRETDVTDQKKILGEEHDAEGWVLEDEEWCLFRSWWNVEDDGYIADNVCRILQEAGETEELLWLLGRAQWIVMRLQRGGINSVEEDLRIGEEVARKKSVERRELLKYLDIVRRAARMSCNAVSQNSYEAWYQMYARVVWYAQHCERTRTFTCEIEQHAPRPWLKPTVGFAIAAGGAALESVVINGRVLCLWHGGDVIRVVQTSFDYSTVAVIEYDKRYSRRMEYALAEDEGSEDSVCASLSSSECNAVNQKHKCTCATFLKRMKKVMTVYRDGRVRFWDIHTGYKLDRRRSGQWSALLNGDSRNVKCVAVTGDGSKIVCGESEGVVTVRSFEHGDSVGIALEALAEGGQVECVAASCDGGRVVCVLYNGSVHVWDGSCGTWMAVATEIRRVKAVCAAVSADGGRIVLGSFNSEVVVWDIDSTERSVRKMMGHSDWVRCVAISSDGRVAVSGSRDCTACVWDAEKGEMIGAPLLEHTAAVEHVAISADCNEVVSTSDDGTLRVWDVERNVETSHDSERFTISIECFAYVGSGTRAVLGSNDGCVRLMNVENGQVIGEPLRGHTDSVNLVALSGDGTRIVSASYDGTVRVWDADSGATVGAPLRESAECVAVSNDGTRAVVGLLRGPQLIVFDTGSGRIVERLSGYTDTVCCCAMSRDWTRVVSGGEDNTVRIWDVTTCSAVSLRGHTASVWCVAWSADGKRVVSGSLDRTVRLWDVDTAQPIGDPIIHNRGVRHVQTDAQGVRVLSIDVTGHGRLWDVTRAECIIDSTHSAWAHTVHRFGLAQLEIHEVPHCGMQITARNAAGQGQLLASTDRFAIQVGEKYFAKAHTTSFVPFGHVLR